jgi:hypothetical protein
MVDPVGACTPQLIPAAASLAGRVTSKSSVNVSYPTRSAEAFPADLAGSILKRTRGDFAKWVVEQTALVGKFSLSAIPSGIPVFQMEILPNRTVSATISWSAIPRAGTIVLRNTAFLLVVLDSGGNKLAQEETSIGNSWRRNWTAFPLGQYVELRYGRPCSWIICDADRP